VAAAASAAHRAAVAAAADNAAELAVRAEAAQADAARAALATPPPPLFEGAFLGVTRRLLEALCFPSAEKLRERVHQDFSFRAVATNAIVGTAKLAASSAAQAQRDAEAFLLSSGLFAQPRAGGAGVGASMSSGASAGVPSSSSSS
jgi:hypothetical protein